MGEIGVWHRDLRQGRNVDQEAIKLNPIFFEPTSSPGSPILSTHMSIEKIRDEANLKHVHQQSTYFSEAESRAKISFDAHKLLECDCNGLEYTDDVHDITFRVPKGAVNVDQKIHFEVAVAMHGPFKFPENTQPISPIVWLCLLEENTELLKPFSHNHSTLSNWDYRR